ncbi:MAG: hypothetical protein C3F08_03675 [Candidatus Methylomirabilota bacterium]|nr:MAG: hypothetical protein C3F08_03675 [candidate division NC10 bacterium]
MTGGILVVDDSEGTRTLVAGLLSARGYRVTTAPDGLFAWRLLQQSSASYDLVITDVVMPSMNGIELLEKMRTTCPWTRVVLVTGQGYLNNAITARAYALGAFAVLPKPCSFEQLHDTVKRALLHSAATEE